MDLYLVALLIVVSYILIPGLIMVGCFAAVLISEEPYVQQAIVQFSHWLVLLSFWLSAIKVRYKHTGRHRQGEVRRVTNAELVGIRWGWAHCT